MNIPFRSDTFIVNVELSKVSLPVLVGIYLYKQKTKRQLCEDGLETWPLLQGHFYSSSVYNSHFKNGFLEGKEETIPHTILTCLEFGCYILTKDMQNMYLYLLLFQVGSYYGCRGMSQRVE